MKMIGNARHFIYQLHYYVFEEVYVLKVYDISADVLNLQFIFLQKERKIWTSDN